MRLRVNALAPLLLLVACANGRSPSTATSSLAGPADPASTPAPAPFSGDPPVPATDGGSAAAPACMSSTLLSQLGKTVLLVGADMTSAIAETAPFDVRSMYLAGGLADGSAVCSTCLSGCTAAGVSCAAASGCGWWGCWQDPAIAPGQYARDFFSSASTRRQLPMITYYELLHTSHVAEGPAEVVALADVALMTRYFNDWRFLLQQLGPRQALLHIEPDLWGYAEQLHSDPHKLAAAVASANAADCSGQENSVAGFGRCMIAMVRKYAGSAKVGLHASPWGTGRDTVSNRDPATDVVAEAVKLADFLGACGAAEGDFVVVDAADRDAGYELSLGKQTFWDVSNAALPNFHQAFRWAHALTQRLGKPALWWQLPLGNMAQANTVTHWQDNRVDYFFGHTDEVAATNAFGMVFGAGDEKQTTPSTDGNNLVAKVRALAAAGGQAVCR
jgi:hypothetical protein